MKKIVIRILIVLVVLLVAGIVLATMFMDSIIKKGVETAGPMVAKVETKLDGVKLSVFSGKGTVTGLVVGNPEGYKTPTAIKVDSATLALQPSTLLSDKIVITEINIQGPEITIEGGAKDNNLTKILANVEAFAGTNQPAAGQSQQQGKKLQVNELVLSGGKLNLNLALLGGKTISAPLPDIHLKDLGTGPEGITPADLSKKVLQAIVDQSASAITSVLKDAGKLATDAVKGAGEAAKSVTEGAKEGAEKITKGIGGLFKKKE